LILFCFGVILSLVVLLLDGACADDVEDEGATFCSLMLLDSDSVITVVGIFERECMISPKVGPVSGPVGGRWLVSCGSSSISVAISTISV